MIRPYVCLLSLAALAMADNSNVGNLLKSATDQFTTAMFSEIVTSNPGKSVVLSAFSVMSPLAQLGIASVGPSHVEILRSIGMPNDEVTKATFSQLNSWLKSSKDIDLRMANKIYIAQNYELNNDFAAVSKNVFNSEVKNINFLNNQESAAEINAWVEAQTNHRIKDLVSPNMLTPDTRALLVNAIYFKGAWKYPFIKQATSYQDFHVAKDKVIKVPTMYAKNDYKYVESPELQAQVIEIPYAGESASMVIVLPKEVDGIKELQKKLSNLTLLDTVYKNMYETEVEVYLPKFKIETETNLKKVLQNMNIKRLFSPNEARLDNLLKASNNLYVSDAIQKAFIEVNEEGSEAAAANVFNAVGSSLIINPRPPPVFKADRPFYFVVKVNSVPLFNGVKIV